MEEGFMLVFPEQVLHGAIPNRDFLHLYGPGSLWVLAAGFKVFGTSMWTERAVGLIQLLALIIGIFVISRRWGRTIAVGGAALSAIIILPPAGLTAMAWVGAIALGTWAVWALLRGRALLAGLLAGIALLYRPDLILAITLTFIAAWPLFGAAARKRLLSGTAIGLSPYFVQIALAGPGHAFFGMVLQPVFDLRAGRRLPLPPSWSHLDGFLQGAGELNAPQWPVHWPAVPAQLTLWFLLMLAASAVLGVAGWRSRHELTGALPGRHLLVLAAFSIGLLPQAVQRPDSTHLAWVSAVTFGFLPIALSSLLRTARPNLRTGTRLAIAALAPAVILFILVPAFTLRNYGDLVAQTFGRHREVFVIENAGRSFYEPRPDAAEAVNAMLPVVDQIAKKGDRLFVGPGDLRKTPYSEAFLYYLLPQTRPGTRYIEMDPGVANAENSGLADDLAASDIVILSSIRDDWHEPNASLDFGSEQATKVLQTQFCMVGSWGKGLYGRGLYELYQRCDRR
jgi:hypothetical protein